MRYPIVYVSVSDDRGQLTIDGDLALLRQALSVLRTEYKVPSGSRWPSDQERYHTGQRSALKNDK